MKKILFAVLICVFLVVVLYFVLLIWNTGNETVIEAIEEIRRANNVKYVIYENYNANGVFVYYLRNMAGETPILSTEYVRKTITGKWKWVYGGSHSGTHLSLVDDYNGKGTPLSYQYMPVVAEKQYRIPHPVIFGGISDPEISRIVVKDYKTGLERQVKILEVIDRFRFYVVNVTKSQGLKFDVIAYNAKNEVVYKKTFDEEAQAFGSGGNKSD